MEEYKLTITKTAAQLGVSRKQLSEVVNSNASISPEMALRLEKVFKVEADFWLRLQAKYDLLTLQQSGKLDKLKPYTGKKPAAGKPSSTC